MQGIQYVTDQRGRKVAVMIDLRKHRELWEDFYDRLIARARADEPRERLDQVKERLRKRGKLNG